MKKRLTKLWALWTALALVLSPVQVFATDEIVVDRTDGKTLIVAGSDFQASGSGPYRKKIVTDILESMAEDGLPYADEYLFVGDYDRADPVNADVTNEGIRLIREAFHECNPNITDDKMIFTAGNHDSDVAGGMDVTASGAYEYTDYIIYVINEDDFPAAFNSYGGIGNDGYEKMCKKTATDLMNYLNQKIAASDTRPIFVLCHVPLHVVSRTSFGDGVGGYYIFNVLNQAGAAGLNILFLYGHDHSSGAEDYHGGAAVLLKKGDTIHICQPFSTSNWDERILNFTCLNAGYTGYFGGDTPVDKMLTMTSYLLDECSMEIARYDADGLHNLKSEGFSASNYPGCEDKTVYESPMTLQYTVVDPTMLIESIDRTDLDNVQQEELSYRVLKVELDQHELNLRTDTELQLTATVKPSSALNKKVRWSSSADSIVSVTQDGKIKTLAEGKATITVTTEEGNFTDTCEVIVKDIPLANLSFASTQFTTYVGKEDKLTLLYDPEDTTYPEVTWTSSDESVVSVDQEGHIKGLSLGSATITVTSDFDNTIQTKCIVNVVPTSVNSVTLNKHKLSLLYEESETLVATIDPVDATNQGIIWTSSNEDVVTVDDNGKVVAVGVGDAIITATSQEGVVSDSCEVKVTYGSTDVTSVHLNVHDLVIVEGLQYKFDVQIEPWYATDQEIRWTMYNTWPGHIEKDGTLITEHSADAQIIYAKSSNYKEDSCNLILASKNGSNAKWLVEDGKLTVESGTLSFADANSAPWVNTKHAKEVTTSLVLKDKITEIGDNAFAGLENLTSATIPYTVTSISKTAFSGCEKLATVYVHEGSVASEFDFGDNAVKLTEAHTPDPSKTVDNGDGTLSHVCMICQETYIEEVEESHVHDYNVSFKWAKDGKSCRAVLKCEGYETHTIINDVNVTSEVIQNASCTDRGITRYSAVYNEFVDYKEIQDIPETGHKWNSFQTIDVEPTCTTEGKKSIHCSNCDAIKDEQAIPPLGHAAVIERGKEATCTEPGWSDGSYCSRCGEILTIQERVEPLGHSFGDWIVVTENTCTTEGYQTHSCIRCKIEENENLDFSGHEWNTDFTVDEEPTCTTDGSQSIHCIKCEAKKDSESIPASGHIYESSTIDPTYDSEGSITHTCINCNDTYTESIPKLEKKLSLNVNELKICLGNVYQFVVSVEPTDEPITYSSSDESVVTVENGYIKAVGKGSATITVCAAGLTEICLVTVTDNFASLEGYSLSLDGSIGINFYMKLDDSIAYDENAYMNFITPNGEQKVSVNEATIQEVNGVKYYVFSCRVSAKNTMDEITAQFIFHDELLKEYTYTVEQYANYLMDHESDFDSKSVDIAKAMMTYGKYAQIYFGYSPTIVPTRVNNLESFDFSEYKYILKDENDSLDFVGVRLILTSKPGLKLYFIGDEELNVYGKEVQTTKEGQYTVLTIKDISDMEEKFVITSDNFSLSYSIFSYGNQAMNTSNADLKNLMNAMYAYQKALNQ